MEDKLTVVIPTLWKSEGFLDRLKTLATVEAIGEIILIDNTTNPPDLEIPKVQHIIEFKNTYVNPAWNKGVRMSTYDKICIMNDDVDVENIVFSQALPHITEDKGMIGLYEYHGTGVWEDEPGCDYSRPNYFRKKDLDFKVIEIGNDRKPGYGCFWFIHKNSYLMIPEQIKVWYGDDYIFYRNGKPNYSMINLNIVGKPSQTSDLPEFDEIKRLDYHYYITS